MCIGRAAGGMVKEPVWKGEIEVGGARFAVRVYRPFRDRLTGRSVYFAETSFQGERICVCDMGKGVRGTLVHLRRNLVARIKTEQG